MTPVRYLFLDMDGVLNSREFLGTVNEVAPLTPEEIKLGKGVVRHRAFESKELDTVEAAIQQFRQIDVTRVALLNQIVERTNAKVVISSTWRIFYRHRAMGMMLRAKGFKGECIDSTPELWGQQRGEEIDTWLHENGDEGLESFVILDDDADMGRLLDRLVKTDNAVGLTAEDVEKAVALLETPWE